MDTKELPAHPTLEQYEKQAQDLLDGIKSGHPDVLHKILHRLRHDHPGLSQLADLKFPPPSEPAAEPRHYYQAVALLISAGATLDSALPADPRNRSLLLEKILADAQMSAALKGELPNN
jgi:hypothetical protein